MSEPVGIDDLRPRPGRRVRTRLVAHDGDSVRERIDSVATEEPLEIRITAGGRTLRAAVTMRTPGNDFELAVGFLLAEGILGGQDDLAAVRYCTDVGEEQRYNVVTVDLAGAELPDLHGLERHFTTTSACGVCGRTCLESITLPEPVDGSIAVDAARLARMPEALRAQQAVFDETGGLHAAALFSTEGELVAVREDVGRHNALDKLVGWGLLEGTLPWHDRVVLVSGRASYELVQKAAVAGAPVLGAISAPSSLAIDVARHTGMTLVGFLRGDRFNVYAGADRVVREDKEGSGGLV